MKVCDIMTKNVITVPSDGPIDLVARILIEHRIHGIPVVDGGGKLVGMVTETDFFTKESPNFNLLSYIEFIKKNKPSGKMTKEERDHVISLINSTIADIMSDKCITVNQEDEVEKLLDVFKETKLSSIPVVDKEGLLKGIITRFDVISTIRL